MGIRIATSSKERVVIVGGGFGGLKLARKMRKLNYQVVLIDQNNFHQFQPLFYQVATSGLEPSSIIFPFRKIFHHSRNLHFRMAEALRVDVEEKYLVTSEGSISYDHLVLASGAGNNFFGNRQIEEKALPMKSITESLKLRNIILERFEEALGQEGKEQIAYLTIAIAGGGPTGVELAGTLAEMKRFVLPKDYPELDFDKMKILLIEGGDRVLGAMSEKSSDRSLAYLKKLGVEVHVGTRVNDFDGSEIFLENSDPIPSKTLIWAAGIRGNIIDGIPEEVIERGNRIRVNEFNQVEGLENVYAIGDVAYMTADKAHPNGHPQLAQVAIQQGDQLQKNLKNRLKNNPMEPFTYKNLGTMATIGRNKAVVELPRTKFYGFFAWTVWMVVHLRSILGVKNKFVVFMNWVWNYFTYNLSLRLIIKRNDDFDKEPDNSKLKKTPAA